MGARIGAEYAFYAASVFVDRGEFRRFVQSLLSHNPALHTLEWIPRVSHAARSGFENKIRLDGFPDFQIRETTVGGKPAPAGRRAEYFPIHYLEPIKGNESKLGLDLASVPATAQALSMARDTGKISATSRLAMGPEQPDKFRFLLINAIYQKNTPLDTPEQRRRHLEGFVLGVFRITDVVQKALAEQASSDIDVYLFDDSAPVGDRFLSFVSPQTPGRDHSSVTEEMLLKEDVHFVDSIDVAGRKWRVVCVPSLGSRKDALSWQPWFVLGLGLLITGFFAFYAWFLSTRMTTSQQYSDKLLRTNELLEQEIAERRHAQESLQKRELQLLESQRIAHIGSWERDLTTNRVIWSDELFHIMGFDPRTTEASYRLLLDVIHPEDRDLFMKAGQKAISEGKPYSVDFRLVRKDGSVVIVHSRAEVVHDESGRPVLFHGTLQDITATTLAAAREAGLARVLETSLNEIYIFNAEMLKFVFVNQGARDNLGYSMEELRQKTPLDLKPEFTLETFKALLAPLSSDNSRVVRFTTIHLRKDKSVYPVEVHLQRSVFEQTPVYVAIILDISERKKLEAQLLQSQKMEAVGKLAGGIAHDFNNILTAIIGYVSIMQIKMDPNDPLNVNLDRIYDSAQRAATLTQNLLAFSRKQVLQIQSMDMNEVVRRVDVILSQIIGEDIEISTVLAPGAITILADTGQFEQILVNLAVNARDAMSGGGRLTIKTAQCELDNELIRKHGYGLPGAYGCLFVSDTGKGMDKATLEHIFEPFFTTKDVDKGTGLGLAIVYGVVKQLNGFITVDSEVGKGTTFTIYFPLGSPSPAAGKKEPREAVRGGTETILFAEDNEAIRSLLSDVLRGAGYTVIPALDGEDAVRKFMEHRNNIQLLLLDVIMPKKSGKNVCDEIKNIRPDIKALFISGYTADIIHKRGVRDEGLNFLYKPVTPENLLKKVREILDLPAAPVG